MAKVEETSEFGGVPGIIQPPPHELDPAEQAMLERWLDPSDVETSEDQLLAERRKAWGQ